MCVDFSSQDYFRDPAAAIEKLRRTTVPPSAQPATHPRAAIAASSRRRSPTAATPISFRSSVVSSESTSQLIAFSSKAGAYFSRPSPPNQSAMSTAPHEGENRSTGTADPDPLIRKPGQGPEKGTGRFPNRISPFAG